VLAVTGLNQNTLELWNASTWQTIGAAGTIGFGSNYRVHALLALPNGDALVGGDFLRINGLDFFRIARWSNGTWLPVGGGFGSTTSSDSVQALAALPNGDVIAGGYVPLSGLSSIARWNGTTWSPFVNAVASGTEDLAVDPRGEIAYAGSFFTAGGALSAYLARIRAPCPATAMVAGAGCTGSGGPNVLAAASLPWLGTILKATATGMPATSVAVAVYGFGTASTAAREHPAAGWPRVLPARDAGPSRHVHDRRRVLRDVVADSERAGSRRPAGPPPGRTVRVLGAGRDHCADGDQSPGTDARRVLRPQGSRRRRVAAAYRPSATCECAFSTVTRAS
jgi:hypothetical protein